VANVSLGEMHTVDVFAYWTAIKLRNSIVGLPKAQTPSRPFKRVHKGDRAAPQVPCSKCVCPCGLFGSTMPRPQGGGYVAQRTRSRKWLRA
jgi:hypothetical protein